MNSGKLIDRNGLGVAWRGLAAICLRLDMERVPQRQRKGQAGAAENTEVLVASGAWFDLALRVFHGELKKTFLEGNQKKEPQLDTNILYIYI